MSNKLKMIPLCLLKPSSANVRKTDRSGGVEQLAASIEAEGLLENLVVRPVKNSRTKRDIYEVIAGGRRLAALKLLAKRKKIPGDQLVPCLVKRADTGAALQTSLAENFVRLELHPADQFEAFAELHANKTPVDDIAAKFSVTPTFVLQRLKLAAISPRLIAEYRKGAMTLEQLTAFPLSGDHAVQEKVWFDSPYADMPAHTIRRLLTSSQIESSDRRARFIGAQAYEAAGGVIVRDLFDEENDGYYADSQLLDRLVAEKLNGTAEIIRAEGWQWVEVHPEWDYGAFGRYGRAESVELTLSKAEEKRLAKLGERYDALVAALDEEESPALVSELDAVTSDIELLQAKKEGWTDEEKARAGAVVCLGSDGALKVVRGLLRPDAIGRTATNGKGPPVQKHMRGNGYADSVLLELSAERTAALQEVLAANPEAALTALLHTLVGRLFYNGPSESCLGIVATATALDRASEAIGNSKAARSFHARQEAWSGRMPGMDKLWDWLASLDATDRFSLLAHCVARTITALHDPTGRSNRHESAKLVAKTAGLDMRMWWRPSQAFLDRLTKAEILSAISEGVSASEAHRLEGLKKNELTKKAEALLVESTWLPRPWRSEVDSPST